MRIVLWAGLLAGCMDTTTSTDTTTDTTDMTGEVTDETTSGDTDSCLPTFDDDCKVYGAEGQRCAELARSGTGVVTNYRAPKTAYDGTETIQLISLPGKVTVCEITYDLVQGADRTEDCEGKNCEWAFEYTITEPTIVTNEDNGCDGVLAALEICDVSDLDNTVIVRGYDSDWTGHAEVIWTTRNDAWEVVSFSKFDETTGNLNYLWFDGIYPY